MEGEGAAFATAATREILFNRRGRPKGPIRQRGVLWRLDGAVWTLTNNCVRTKRDALGVAQREACYGQELSELPSCVL